MLFAATDNLKYWYYQQCKKVIMLIELVVPISMAIVWEME
ncbi:hypothetical protein CSCA_3753 [Clostridium scatologenes]|uniref:Uncharacterized protein n=1 Tax=Clostridium scatologenes TaxID=1548 RepID=A0A0E3M7L6_CLOSL|nr:hypothetical protein CSCA_3753 [Clostridium scatologenes]